MDMSGNSINGNNLFLGLVITFNQKIQNELIRSEGKYIHMRNIKDKKRQKRIISKTYFDNEQTFAICVKIDRKKIINNIKNKRKVKHQNIPTSKIISKYNKLVMHYMEKRIMTFLNNNGYTLSDIIFQCDQDCLKFAKDNGLRHTDTDSTHILADIVAWANNRGIEPDGVVVLDIVDKVEAELWNLYK